MPTQILSALALSLLYSCATLTDVIQTKQGGGGTWQVYNLRPDVAYGIARDVLRSEGADAIEEHPAEGYMLTSTGNNGVSAGCFVGVWIEPQPPAPYTKVTVVTKRKQSLNAITGLTEETFQRDFATAVARITPR